MFVFYYVKIFILLNIAMRNNLKQSFIGNLLVAHPSNPRDDLHQAVILITDQSQHQVQGLVINSVLPTVTIGNIALSSGFDPMEVISCSISQNHIHWGGHHSMHKVSVIHSNDWSGMSTQSLTDELCKTNDISVISALINDQGPDQHRIIAGCCIWMDLAKELANQNIRKWEIMPATSALVFDRDHDSTWQRGLKQALKYNTSHYMNSDFNNMIRDQN
jgi:putative AlgH/UPF0301 family transcriptional regulator